MPTNLKADFLVWLITIAVPVVGLYFSNKGKIKEAEHRLTVIEIKLENALEKVNHNAERLDNHDEQNKSLLIFAEQLRNLTEDVKELKNIVKGKSSL